MTQVFLIAHQYWPTPGPATARLAALVRELRRADCEVAVATCHPPRGFETQERGPHGERIHFVAPAEIGRSGSSRVRSLLEFAAGVRRLSGSIVFDVVVSDPPPTAGHIALSLATSRGKPFVYYMSDSWAGASKGAKGLAGAAHPIIKRVEYRVLNKASQVLAATAGMADIATAANAQCLEVVENGVPLDVFHPKGTIWNPTGNNRPFLLYAGNAGVVHGAHVFVEGAVKLWKDGLDFDLVFMGYGRGLAEVEVEASEFPGRLHLVASQPLERVAAAFRASAAGLCSLRPNDLYADARPIKSMTGLACGAPAVFVGSGAFANMVSREGLGFARPWGADGAADAMREALQQLADDRAHATLRSKCVDFAHQQLSDRASAQRAASLVLAAVQRH